LRRIDNIDKEIAVLKAELNYARTVDRQQYASGVLAAERAKSPLARGVILVSGGYAGEGDDSDAVSNQPDVNPPVLDFDEPEVKKTSVKCIWPRSKHGQDHAFKVSKPVFLDEATVSKFFHLPLYKAAAKLGISNTSLKTACRKVGLKKWPYRTIIAAARRTTPSSSSSSASNSYRLLQEKKAKHESSESPQPLDSFSSLSCSVASLLN